MPRYMWKGRLLGGGHAWRREGWCGEPRGLHRQARVEPRWPPESFDFAFGHPDVHVIAELADDTTAAAVAMAVASSGAGSTETVKLITPAEADAALAIDTGIVRPAHSCTSVAPALAV
jgi:GYD domain